MPLTVNVLTPSILVQGNTVEPLIQLIPTLVIALPYYIGLYVTFKKANVSGWKAILPVYNWYVMLKIGGEDGKWIFGLFLPILNIYAIYKYHASLAKAFGQGVGFGILGLVLPMVYAPLLAFGDYQYQNDRQYTANLSKN